MKQKLSKSEVKEVINILLELYPDAKAELNFSTPFELLIATILSAQCTDVRVNKTTDIIFKEYNTPEAFLTLSSDELGDKIKSCGFYNMKSRNILSTCSILVNKYNSKVPDKISELLNLPGVGRKTANVVVSNAYGIPAIAVDTHVFRVTNRIGVVNEKDVEHTEFALQKAISKELWTKSHHLFIFHGRRVCKAVNPKCLECKLNPVCLYYNKSQKR